jgi:hypothetical protein
VNRRGSEFSCSKNESMEFRGDPAEYAAPIARAGLPENSHGGVPAGVLPSEPPAPVREMRQDDPDRPPERPGEVGNGSVNLNDQIKVHDHGGGIIEVPELRVEIHQIHARRRRCRL